MASPQPLDWSLRPRIRGVEGCIAFSLHPEDCRGPKVDTEKTTPESFDGDICIGITPHLHGIDQDDGVELKIYIMGNPVRR